MGFRFIEVTALPQSIRISCVKEKVKLGLILRKVVLEAKKYSGKPIILCIHKKVGKFMVLL